MIDWNNIIERSHGMAKEKGWWNEPRSVEECLMLAVTEVAEAVEWYRDFKGDPADVFKPATELVYPGAPKQRGLQCGEFTGETTDPQNPSAKPVGIPSELADVCIRVCDLMGYSKCAAECVDGFEYEFENSSFVTQCFLLTNKIATAFPDDEGPLKNEEWDRCIKVNLCGALACVQDIAEIQGIDLAAAIEVKLAYNATRENRHGGKRA